MKMIFSASAKEARLLGLFKEVGSNARTWGKDVGDTYIKKPMDEGNAPKTVAGAGMAVASTILEAPDYLVAGALDNKLDPPPAGALGRTRRDLAQLAKNIVTVHPIRAVTDACRLATTDLPLDVPEMFLALDRDRANTRYRIHQTLAA
jgi:hypothetical protein